MIQTKNIPGYLATDSEGWQYLFKREPKRILYKKQDIRNIDGEAGVIQKNGEWKCRKGFKDTAELHKFLLGRDYLQHTWQDEPVKTTITIQVED